MTIFRMGKSMADFMTGTAGRHYLELPAEPSSVSCAREHVAVVLASFGLSSRELLDDAQLITSELVTNAITASVACASGGRSAGKRVRVSAALSGSRLTLEFWDDGAGVPRQVAADDYDVRGRGLCLVDALCRRWGYHRPRPGEKIVWVELDVEPYLCEAAASR